MKFIPKVYFINKQFTQIFYAQFLSGLADKIILFILPLWILEVTRSSIFVSILSACSTIAIVILSPFMGTFVDRLYKKNLMLVANSIRCLLLILLAVITILGYFDFLYILLIFIVYSFGSTLHSPAANVALTIIVNDDELQEAVAIRQTSNQLESVLAPTLGGLLFSVFSPGNFFLINGLCFVLSLLILLTSNITEQHKAKAKQSFLVDLKEGVSILFQDKILKTFLFSAAIINILGAAIMLTLRVIVINMEVSSLWWSLIFVGSPVGVIIGAFMSMKWKVQSSIFIYGFICCAVMGFFNILMSLANAPRVLTIFYFLSGIAFGMGNTYFGIMYRRKIPVEKQGRFFGFLSAALLISIPVGQVFTGVLLDSINPNLVMGILGLLTVVTALVSIKVLGREQKKKIEYSN
ncbi:MFS transporter [Lysinibacillus sphaericus]|uniref:MFS transporter n=1 Tax=Lysinibacillus sphaericus TaxID=1421 RepID=A0A2S0K193_LYSSH|nr:MFS transporter [Lysinibacillus sphaericus]AVK97162.1 MFS transporter [Lysinibacillus sphaericus]MED4542449.1 MFS transporter [Lysinibacillus sphaericus]TKI20152.1 MFS transporter [Lysinibacillus sphaericus]SUV16962.1 multidrug resistance protein [Lysinibacillus sphaericus]GEC84366.1 MFS transporter [Lysinibacillus sphaericus]